MKKEDTEMMLRIFETERAGYAYLYPSDGGERKEDYILSLIHILCRLVPTIL